MKKLLTILLILMASAAFSQWTVQEDTVINISQGDTTMQVWEAVQTPHPNGIILKINYTEYLVYNGELYKKSTEQYRVARSNADSVGAAQVTIQWLKDQTFTNRNYIKQWALWEIEKLKQKVITEPEPE